MCVSATVTNAKNFSISFNDTQHSTVLGSSPLIVSLSDTNVSHGDLKETCSFMFIFLMQPTKAQITHSATIVDLTTLDSNETISFTREVTTREYFSVVPTLSINRVSFLMENVTIKLDAPYASCMSFRVSTDFYCNVHFEFQGRTP